MDLISLLSQILGDYQKHAGGEHYFSCPFCHHHSKKFAVNVIKNKWQCWHCSARGGNLITLFKRLEVSKQQLIELKSLLRVDQVRNYREDEATTVAALRLPSEYKPLWVPGKSPEYKHALTYLVRRGITPYDVMRYQMGYTESGDYAHRIIIPSYDGDGKLNYFTARSFFDSKLKYKNPPISKNVIVFENQINWNLPVVLCEGMFDAIAIRRNAIPLLGKHIPKKLMKSLITHKVSTVYVVLDPDAISNALELEQRLKQHSIDVKQVVLDYGDASDRGFTEIWKYIEQGTETTFKNYISNKLLHANFTGNI